MFSIIQSASICGRTLTRRNVAHSVIIRSNPTKTRSLPAKPYGANTVFTIDANDTVTLDGVTKTSLTAGNFHFT
jgi:hypothetical protein